MAEVRRLCGALGAEVSGVDLSNPSDEGTAQLTVSKAGVGPGSAGGTPATRLMWMRC